ncbi:MAG TPA: hypothetical protein VEL10_11745 [Gaiellaceae bacterium]|nr:hypothetical protein [Gaiellaceae bacterium]
MAEPLIKSSSPKEIPSQPPITIVSEPPAAGANVSLEQALANAKRQVDAAK